MSYKHGTRRSRVGTAVHKDKSRMIIGRNAIQAAINTHPERIKKLLVAHDVEGKAKQLINQAQQLDLSVERSARSELNKLANGDTHQGMIAYLEPLQLGDRKELINNLSQRDSFLVIALDSILDPHNLGAILRASECFGVDAVVWSKNRSPGITPAVTKVAVGATEIVPLYEVSNIAEILLALQTEAGATVLCADGSDQSIDILEYSSTQKEVLDLGAEGQGVSDLIQRRADYKIKIPLYGVIDSLNVSQAAAVLLYQLKRMRQ